MKGNRKQEMMLVPDKEWGNLLNRLELLEQRRKQRINTEKEHNTTSSPSLATTASSGPKKIQQQPQPQNLPLHTTDHGLLMDPVRKSRKQITASEEDEETDETEEVCMETCGITLDSKKESWTFPFWFIIMAIAFLVFVNGLWGGLVFDDTEVIKSNQDVRGTTPWWELWVNDYWGKRINEKGVWSCKVLYNYMSPRLERKPV